MDITYFIQWFINQVVTIFSDLFDILDSITFANTSLLKVIISIVIISTLIPIIMTIAPTGTYNTGEKVGKSERKKIEQEKKNKKGESKK